MTRAAPLVTDHRVAWPGVEAGPGYARRVRVQAWAAARSVTCTATARSTSASRRPSGRALRAGPDRLPPGLPRQAGLRRARDRGRPADVRDVIALLRLNYERARSRARAFGPTRLGARAAAVCSLACDPGVHPRARARRHRDLQHECARHRRIAPVPEPRARGDVRLSDVMHAPLFLHEADREELPESVHVRGHVLPPARARRGLRGHPDARPHAGGHGLPVGHAGSTACCSPATRSTWRDGEWVPRAAADERPGRPIFQEDLELIRTLDFDVLVPWAATAGQPYYAVVDQTEAREHIETIIERIRRCVSASAVCNCRR